MILNLTARKKRDTMMPYTNITALSQQGGAGFLNDAAIINGGYAVPNAILWCATGRLPQATDQSTSPAAPIYDASRTASNVFMRGLSETVQIQVSDGIPWQWRRICFTFKGINAAMPKLDTSNWSLTKQNANGYQRAIMQVPNNTYRDTLENLLFKGAKFRDWTDAMTASLDNSRVTVKYDKTRTIASGNEDGCIRKYKLWHPMNKTLAYDDDESGGGIDTQSFSVQSKVGMGDYLVADFFLPRTGSTSSNKLSFAVTSSLYWHEK